MGSRLKIFKIVMVSSLVGLGFGCSSEKMKELIVGTGYTLYIPNAFTPNGDFIDEFFAPKGDGDIITRIIDKVNRVAYSSIFCNITF